MLLVPERVTMLTTLPPAFPYSAEKLLLSRLNSWTASGLGNGWLVFRHASLFIPAVHLKVHLSANGARVCLRLHAGRFLARIHAALFADATTVATGIHSTGCQVTSAAPVFFRSAAPTTGTSLITLAAHAALRVHQFPGFAYGSLVARLANLQGH